MSSGKIMIQFNIFSPCFLERQLSTSWYIVHIGMGNHNTITLNALLIRGGIAIASHPCVCRFWSNNMITFLCHFLPLLVPMSCVIHLICQFCQHLKALHTWDRMRTESLSRIINLCWLHI